MAVQAAGSSAGVDPLVASDPWAVRPQTRDRRSLTGNHGMPHDSPGSASSSWGSWVPVQAQAPVSLGASTVTTLDTASSGPAHPHSTPVPAIRDDVQSILRAAIEMLMDDRRQRSQGAAVERPVPQLPQLLQGLRGPSVSTPMEVTAAATGLPIMVQPLTRSAPQDAGRQTATRSTPPHLTSFIFGSTLQRPVDVPAAPSAAASSWENPSMQIARSMALRQMVQATAVPVPPDPQDNTNTQPPAG